ncbi:outer membrane autotransporter barrel domain-containing protein [Paraburkholderia fungorum]|uniref:Outer membrane autotransporter barrel domain-containing protein n=2 Tax=Paraburkholderia fungorum TaxID=134537 RepID=A0A1H1I9D5_9BURK|nr:outer membrane autotransporter barrel domain-containing protein [Paraburkholderia fungorum]
MVAMGAHSAAANAVPLATLYVGNVGVSGSTIAANYTWDGTTLSVSSTQSIASGQPVLLDYSGTIGTISNLGTLSSTTTINGSPVVVLNSGLIDLIDNQGDMSSISEGIYNDGTIGTIHNAGTITASAQAVDNWGTIHSIDNDGGLMSAGTIVGNNTSAVTIDSITNSGSMTGSVVGIRNLGTITSIDNTADGDLEGLTTSAILNSGTLSSIGAITNEGNLSGGAEAVLNQGKIGSIDNSGDMLGSSYGLLNSGAASTIGTFTNEASGYINGEWAVIENQGSIGSLSNLGTINQQGDTNGAVFNLGTIGAFSNSGEINSVQNTAVLNQASTTSRGATYLGSIGSLTNSGLISGGLSGVVNAGGTISVLDNQTGGTITGGAVGIYNANSTQTAGVVHIGTIGTLSNAGMISGETAIANDGLIGTLTNSGTIAADEYALDNTGTINALINTGSANGTLVAFKNESTGTIGALLNEGSLYGHNDAVVNVGSIGSVDNSGSMTGASNGFSNQGMIDSLVNEATGTITATYEGLYNSGTITSMTNAGTLSATSTAIENKGSIGTLTNTGLITGSQNAIENGGSIGTIVNAGVIAGNINNIRSSALTIDGGTGTIFGTLTGYDGAAGTISSTAADLTFGSGNLLLNDSIDVGTNTVYNSGATLEVDGITTITGNYSQGEAATLLIGVSSGAIAAGSLSDTGYGRLVVSGNAEIDAGSTVTLKSTTGAYSFAAGQRYVVVDAAGTGTYNASALNYSIAGYTASLSGTSVTTSDGHTDLVVTVDSLTGTDTSGTGTGGTDTSGSGTSTDTGTSSGSTGRITPTTSNARSAMSGLTAYTGVSDARLLNLYDAAIALQTYGTVADVNHAGAQLAPISQASTARAAAAPTYNVLDIVSTHLNGFRLAQNDGATGVSTGEGTLANGIWGQAFGGHASQDARDSVDGYSANFAGLMFGMDRAVSDAWRVGGVFSYTNSAINNTGDTAGDTTRVNSYGLLGYGSYTASRWYANLSGGAVLQRYDADRQVDFSGFSGAANASFGGTQYVMRGEVGMPLAAGPYTVTPLAALTYSYLHQNGYTESGGNGAALSVGSTHSTSVKSDLGAKLSRDFTSSYGVVVPELTLAWRHEYDHTRASSAASYVGDPTGATSFTTLGSSPVSDLADMTLGVTLLRANNLSLNVRYEVQAGKGYVSQAGSLKLRQLF